MMLLQVGGAELLQVGAVGITLTNTILLIKLAFAAGEVRQTIRDHDRRIQKCEDSNGCNAEDCPLRRDN